MMRRCLRLAAGLLCLALLMSSTARSAAPSWLEITAAEAVRADWNSTAPPADGWTPVSLIDFWDARWPQHDGVVWYRLHWQQSDAQQPAGLLINYVCLASAIYVNGSLLAQDPQLVEPLTRAWIKPQYFLLSAPLLREGENVLLVRVSGLSAYQPGFGTVIVGDPAAVQARYEKGLFERFNIKLFHFAILAVLGGIFLMLWLLRRQDTVYGWFALSEIASAIYNYNYVASSPWPLAGTDSWQAFVAVFYLLAGACYALFLLRFCERRFPRVEKLIGLVCAIAFAVALLAPDWLGPHRSPLFIAGGLFYYVSIGWLLWLAVREPRTDYRVLAVCLLIPIFVSFHDYAMFFGWLRSDTPWLGLTEVLPLIGIAFVLAHRFVSAMHRIETFNVELQREVDAATQKLGATLAREHELALANSRAGERLQLTRDLHDGFGGTLVGAIAQLEAAPENTPKSNVVDLLKEMRDDLRLVIDSTTCEQADLPELLAPLRHRTGRLLEAAEIDSYWHLRDLDGVEMDSARSLDLLRLLQEALTNVFKHSRARRVDVHLERVDRQLQVRVRDDGRGLSGPDSPAVGGGAGFGSMRMRAHRLGGSLHIDSAPGGTELRLAFPLTD